MSLSVVASRIYKLLCCFPEKKINTVATRCHIFRLKCAKIRFRTPDPTAGVYSAPPDHLADGEGLAAPSPRTVNVPRPSASIFGFSGLSPQHWGARIHTAYKSKQRSRSFIFVLIDSSHTTSYRLSIVTFALGRTV